MRAHHVIAIVAAVAIGATIKLFFLSAHMAQASADDPKGFGLDVSRMHVDVSLPVEPTHDMTFVF